MIYARQSIIIKLEKIGLTVDQETNCLELAAEHGSMQRRVSRFLIFDVDLSLIRKKPIDDFNFPHRSGNMDGKFSVKILVDADIWTGNLQEV